mmetsp:Transcript_10811/g.34328  ORF Transcript_10811/g.34328 Transcript_10811/m.34328 type:complete len:403 (+) Transcript_10811:1537-2745(+)
MTACSSDPSGLQKARSRCHSRKRARWCAISPAPDSSCTDLRCWHAAHSLANLSRSARMPGHATHPAAALCMACPAWCSDSPCSCSITRRRPASGTSNAPAVSRSIPCSSCTAPPSRTLCRRSLSCSCCARTASLCAGAIVNWRLPPAPSLGSAAAGSFATTPAQDNDASVACPRCMLLDDASPPDCACVAAATRTAKKSSPAPSWSSGPGASSPPGTNSSSLDSASTAKLLPGTHAGTIVSGDSSTAVRRIRSLERWLLALPMDCVAGLLSHRHSIRRPARPMCWHFRTAMRSAAISPSIGPYLASYLLVVLLPAATMRHPPSRSSSRTQPNACFEKSVDSRSRPSPNGANETAVLNDLRISSNSCVCSLRHLEASDDPPEQLRAMSSSGRDSRTKFGRCAR